MILFEGVCLVLLTSSWPPARVKPTSEPPAATSLPVVAAGVSPLQHGGLFVFLVWI